MTLIHQQVKIIILDNPIACFCHIATDIIPFDSVRRLEVAEITPTRVTQGKTLNGNEKLYQAPHAVDKDLSSVSVCKTDNGAGWLKLQFERTFTLHKVVIYYKFYSNWYDPTNGCVQNTANFKQCVNSDNNVDVSVYQGEEKKKSCGTLQLTYGLKQSDQIYTLICNTEGDNAKLSKTTGHIVVYEVAVTSTGITTTISILFV